MFGSTEEEEGEPIERGGFSSFVLKYGIFIVLGLLAIFGHGHLGQFMWDKATAIGLIGIIAVVAMQGTWGMMKASSPQFIFDGGHFPYSSGRSIYQLGNFNIVRPTIEAWNMYFPQKSPVVVTTIDSGKPYGMNMSAMVHTDMVTIEELPMDVRGYIIEHDYRPPYFLGLAGVEQYQQKLKDAEKDSGIDEPTVAYLVVMVKEQNKIIAMMQTKLAQAYNVNEEAIAAMMRIGERLKPSTISDRARALIYGTPKGEET
jgi:hypothetical protein